MSKTLIAKEWSLARFTALPLEEQDGMFKGYAGLVAGVKAKKDDERESAIVIGIGLHVLEIRLNKGKELHLFPLNKSLTELFKDITGANPPTHALTLKNAYAYVTSGFIPEKDYLLNSSNCLQLAARILAEAKSFDHPAIALTVKELTERSKDEAKNLRKILAELKPAKTMTPDEALEAMEEILLSKNGVAAFAHAADVIANLDQAERINMTLAAMRLMETVDEQLPDEIRGKLDHALSMAQPVAVQVLPNSTAPAPAPAAEPETDPVASQEPTNVESLDQPANMETAEAVNA